ncbi:MAG TPA: histidine phosphatase family protein [Terriglobales bacterium]|nr:histidine phosphatase family protein [Terriglobales bacterium]
METRTLYLVRHGELIIDERHHFLGQLDLPLSPKGKEQAHELCECCELGSVTGIYCSDLCRSRETAEIIARPSGMPVTACGRLREISLGMWEGRAIKDIETHFPWEFHARGQDIEHYRPPSGESFADCRIRVLAALQEILDSASGDIVIVGHAGVNRLILCEALGIPIANIFNIGQEYGCLNILEYGTHGCRVKLLNFVPHRAIREQVQVAAEGETVAAI